MNLCNQCGACCRVLTLEQSPAEVQSIAALTRALGIPSDHAFAAEHWHPLTRTEAMRRNPFYVSRLPETAHLYWYDQPVRDMALADPRCGYAHDQIVEFVIRRNGD